MTRITEVVVERRQLATAALRTRNLPAPEALAEGQALLAVGEFALTANNVTYAALGDALRYWEFFPAGEGLGIVPVWGFAEVLASRCPGVEPGERFYGYYPMASHLLVAPAQVRGSGFVDASEHRRNLPSVYNQYLRCSSDPLYRASDEALQMLLRPLFTTSFLLDDFLAEHAFFGATDLLLSSASSKTAIGLAFLLQRNRAQRGQDYRIVGLTSAGNRAFVEGLGGPRADGKALAAGDSLGWLADGARPRALPLPSERIMDCTGEARLELILGAQIGDFPAMSLFDAFNGDWQVDTRADRMGVRLLGPRLECRQQSMISEGIALGAVQVPPDGQPIVLLNDRQTIGGYPRLGALAPLALARLAQCLPGQRVRLLPTVQEAAHREHRRLLAAWDA